MAFRLPDQRLPKPHNHERHHQQQQQQAARSPSSQASPLPLSPSAFARPDETDSTEWVIFSPTQAHSAASTAAARGDTVSTGRTPRLSDFGSLGSRNGHHTDHPHEQENEDGNFDEDLLAEEEEEENTELDSLDDGLRAFREPSMYAGAGGPPDPAAQLHQSDPAMLPAHDGLGTFPASSMNVQNQLWQHERFNPHRKGEIKFRRQSSVHRHLDSIAESQPRDSDHDRWQRIENWRMDQGRAFLQEVEKETRHERQTSRTSRANGRTRAVPRLSTSEVMGDVSVEPANYYNNNYNNTSEGKDTPAVSGENAGIEESFWRRITRKVIKDLIGLDDSLLSVILGESLMPIAEEDGKMEESESESAQQQAEGHAKKRKASTILEMDLPEEMDEMLKTITTPHQGDTWWQERLLDRIARELGSLVHHLREDPGAFSAYKRSQSSPSHEYPSTPTPPFDPTLTSSSQLNLASSKAPSHSSTRNMSVRSPHFTPTLQDTIKNTAPHAESWGLEDEQRHPVNRPTTTTTHPPPQSPSRDPVSETASAERDTEYWERDLDVGLVFQYLRKRLFADKMPYARNSSQRRVDSPSHRAAIIRQHHPLVARAHELARSQRPLQRNQTYSNSAGMTTSPTGAGAGVANTASPILHRRMRRRSSSSCASQSTRCSVSTRRTLASGSSRNYWDIGGSVGSGSAVVAAVGGAGGGMSMGSLGDV